MRSVTQRRITPPVPGPGVIARPRLSTRIRAAVDRSDLIAVTAAAGAGKTTAVAQALEDHPGLAWLHLDRTDSAPERLVAHLYTALRLTVSDLSEPLDVLPPTEAAGALAAHAAAHQVTLVLDAVERLADSPAAAEILRSVVEYGANGLTIVLLGRRPTAVLPGLPLSVRVEELPPSALDADLDEVRAMLSARAVDDRRPTEVLGRTGGWVSAVLELAGDAHADFDRLTETVLGDLPPALTDFLELTAPLEELTAVAAAALGLADVDARLHDLSRIPVPGRWFGAAFRCHPVFRERLLARFDRRAGDQTREVRVRLARWYLRDGHPEHAVTELLRACAVAEALPVAEAVIMPVVDRGDLALAETWMARLPAERTEPDAFTTARLMLAIARDDFTRGAGILTWLEATGTRDALAARSDRAASMMAWCYMHQGRPEALGEVLALARSASLTAAVRYASWMITNPGGDDPPVAPPLRGEPSDALILIADYTYGRRGSLAAEQMTEWVRIVSRSGRIAALRAAGRLSEALREHDEAVAAGDSNLALRVYIGPELLIDAGAADRARDAVEQGRTVAEATGSVGYRALNAVAAAKFQLRLADDAAAARSVLDNAEHLIQDREFRLISGVLDTWYGLALLRQNVNLAAASRLRRAVRSMREGHRLLELPIAAAYLAEAEWRLGDEAAADRAADLALHTSEVLGSHHQLLRALRDMPEVVSRRIDAVPDSDSPWHAVGRALLMPEPAVATTTPRPTSRIHLRDFGPPELDVGGQRRRPRIVKSYELIALLATAPSRTVTRANILTSLFSDRPPGAASTYLRQAGFCLRQVLRDPADLEVGNGRIGFTGDVVLTSDAGRFETLLAEATHLSGPERLDALAEALSLADVGAYLAGTESPWVQQRRGLLAERVATARFDAAELAFALGRLRDAAAYCDAVLAADPYQEAASRLRMRIAGALGSDAGVLTAYRRCAAALAELGTEPAASTRRLLDQLRR